MKNWSSRINIYLLLIVLIGGWGCSTTDTDKKDSDNKKKKIPADLVIHIETNPDDSGRTVQVPIYREAPKSVTVDKMAVLDTSHIDNAAITESMGSFAIQLQFNQLGSRILDMLSTEQRGRRLAIFCNFGEPRWIAAPRLSKRIQNGIFIFTPDASREEAQKIVDGLNYSIEKRKKKE